MYIPHTIDAKAAKTTRVFIQKKFRGLSATRIRSVIDTCIRWWNAVEPIELTNPIDKEVWQTYIKEVRSR